MAIAKFYKGEGQDNIEEYLKGLGAKFVRRDSISVKELQPGWDAQNPCRDGPAIIETSMNYAERMSAGSKAPAAIITKTATGYSILDGRQRVFASTSILDDQHFAAYEVIKPGPRLERAIAIGANVNLNGVRPSQEFSIREALEFGASHGATNEEMADLAGVSIATIKQRVVGIKVRGELQRRGVNPQVPNGSIAALGDLLDDPHALRQAYGAIEKSRATVQMSQALVSDMMKANGTGRLHVVDRYLKRNEIKARMSRRNRTTSPMEQAFRSARALRTILKNSSPKIDGEMSSADRVEFMKITKYILSKARQLCPEQKV
jgi:hypothetical protein